MLIFRKDTINFIIGKKPTILPHLIMLANIEIQEKKYPLKTPIKIEILKTLFKILSHEDT